jgi:hypothetical protein
MEFSIHLQLTGLLILYLILGSKGKEQEKKLE